MQCYVCVERGTETPAVALCRSCQAGLCLEHLREAAERFASDKMLAGCHHDTGSVANGHGQRRWPVGVVVAKRGLTGPITAHADPATFQPIGVRT